MRTTAVVLAGLVGLGGSAFAGDGVVREGAGERRAELDAMEIAAFDAGLIDGLGGWQNTEPLTADQLDGKVVVLFTWASWYPTSMRALPVAQRVADQWGDKGVVVIGVHHPDEYAGAEKQASRRRVTFPIAHDADGALREALLVDQDPDFYVIDRAGQLRFADIETGSVMAAVEELAGESRDEARSLPDRLEARAEQLRIEARRSHRVSDQYVQALRTEVPFELPGPDVYSGIEWSDEPDDDRGRRRSSQENIGSPFPAFEALGSLDWLGDGPTTKGRTIVVAFWDPSRESDWGTMGKLEAVQDIYKPDVVVIALAGSRDLREDRVRATLGERERSAYHAFDPDGQIAESVRSRRTPYALVLSSDGVIRWEGDPNEDEFDGAVQRVFELDPGIKARKAARKAYLEKLKNDG